MSIDTRMNESTVAFEYLHGCWQCIHGDYDGPSSHLMGIGATPSLAFADLLENIERHED